MPITASYVLTFAHYDAMCRASEDSLSRWLSRWAFWPLVIVNGLLGLAILVDRIEAGDALGWTAWFNVGVAFTLLAGRYVVVPLMRRYAYRSTRLGGRDYNVTLTSEVIELDAGAVSSQIGVSEIIRANETKAHFFFWFNKRQAAIVPKEAINPPDGIDEVRRYITANGWETKRQ